jgi:hypothetical protein
MGHPHVLLRRLTTKQYLRPRHAIRADTAPMPTNIDRLRTKIDSYIALLQRVRDEEHASKQLAKAFPNEDHAYPCTAETKVLDTLRPLIFEHWTKILHQIPEPGWKHACTTIASIDRMREKAKRGVGKEEEEETIMKKRFITAPTNEDELADLLTLCDSEEEEDSPVVKRRKPAFQRKFDLKRWIDDDIV